MAPTKRTNEQTPRTRRDQFPEWVKVQGESNELRKTLEARKKQKRDYAFYLNNDPRAKRRSDIEREAAELAGVAVAVTEENPWATFDVAACERDIARHERALEIKHEEFQRVDQRVCSQIFAENLDDHKQDAADIATALKMLRAALRKEAARADAIAQGTGYDGLGGEMHAATWLPTIGMARGDVIARIDAWTTEMVNANYIDSSFLLTSRQEFTAEETALAKEAVQAKKLDAVHQ